MIDETTPVLRLEESGSWSTVLFLVLHSKFVRMNTTEASATAKSIARVHAELRPPIQEWFDQHDPDCRILSAGSGVWVTFSDENAAMLFRLTFGATIERSE